MFVRGLFRPSLVLSLAFTLVQVMPAAGQQKKTGCSKRPEFVPPPEQSKEEKQKQPETKVQGTVGIEISKDGQVVKARAIRRSSGEAADQLVSLAQSMKFEPPPGSGVFKTVVNYDIG